MKKSLIFAEYENLLRDIAIYRETPRGQFYSEDGDPMDSNTHR